MKISQFMGPSIKDVGNFSQFMTPTLLHRQFFIFMSRQIRQIVDPLPSEKCRGLKWMVPIGLARMGQNLDQAKHFDGNCKAM